MSCLRVLACLSFAVTLAVAGVTANPAVADPAWLRPPPAHNLPTCTALPAKLLGGPIKFVSSQVVPANTAPTVSPLPNSVGGAFTGTTPSTGKIAVAYCLVVLSYSTNAEQNVTIYVGLPLNTTDGGVTGSIVDPPWNFKTVQGNWNGRTEGTGGGGCAGNTSGSGGVVTGFVGSGTDGGHGPGNTLYGDDSCDQAVPSLGHLNVQYITDWVYNGPQQEILQSKAVATLYYGRRPLYNYWNGCSTGGHQGYALAQTLAGELDGILASAPAMYWTRFQTAQMWGQIAMYDIAPNEVIAGGKLAAVQVAAINACDGNDGVLDGIIDDPRTCTFNANANVCGQSTAPASPNCLTSTEANAVNVMWDGPRNSSGKRIWFPIDRGTDFSFWDGNVPFSLAPVQFGWDLENPAYYAAGVFPSSYPGFWGNVALNAATEAAQGNTVTYVTNYAAVAQDGSNNVADLSDTFGDLDAFRAKGGKMVTFVGANDALIMPRGVLNYYRVMAQRYALRHDSTGFDGVQQFYRLFHVPGTSHCGLPILSNGASLGPWPQGGVDFDAVINWVENGVAPSEVIGTGDTNTHITLTRPTCPYPQTAVYLGTGSVDQAQNWVCGGNLEKNVPVGTPLSGPAGLPVPCYDVLVQYKHEVNGQLDYEGSGVNPATCGIHGH